jgi:hypothetical protein
MTVVVTPTPAPVAAPTGISGFFHKLEAGFQKDEAWVIAEFTKGWQLLQSVGHTLAVDIQGIFAWVQAHQASLLAIFQQALQAIGILSATIPGGGAAGAAVAAAITAINAATATVNVLGKAVINGSTPLSTAVSAYHAVKDAQTAVNGVIKGATTQPAAVGNGVALAPTTHSAEPVPAAAA